MDIFRFYTRFFFSLSRSLFCCLRYFIKGNDRLRCLPYFFSLEQLVLWINIINESWIRMLLVSDLDLYLDSFRSADKIQDRIKIPFFQFQSRIRN